MKDRIAQLQAFVQRHEEALLPVFLLFGFVVDGLTLRRVDLLPETLLIYGYLLLSGGAIFITHLVEEGVWWGKLAERASTFLPLLMTYAFGSLFSAFVIFYVKSASLTDSWPFIVVLISVVLGVEILKKYQHRFVFNLAVYFLALFSFTIFSVPLWRGELGITSFAVSGLLAVFLFSIFVFALFLTGRSRIQGVTRPLVLAVAFILLSVSTLYATNTLPPIPLVLKDIGVYHDIARENGSYRLTGEPYSLIDRLLGITVHAREGESLHVFSSVFTPVAIKTDIVHRWEKYDPAEDDWVESTEVSFPVSGGRDAGYRGFSTRQNVTPGLWRVSVETPDGLKIGRIEFTVVFTDAPALVTEVR